MKVWADAKFQIAWLIAGLAAGLCIATSWEAKTDKSFWDIASAMGTVGAAVIALGISLAQSTARRSRERAHAILVAARIAGTVDAAAGATGLVHWAFIFAQEPQKGAFFENVKEKATAATAVSTEDLMPLLPLPNHCAHRMATALGLIEMICTDTRGIGSAERWEKFDESARAFFYERWRVWAEEANRLMTVAQRDFANAVSLGVASPTDQEAYGIR